MAFCLVPKQVDDFITKIKDGSIDVEKMSTVSSEERHKLLSSVVGEENATQVNALFESKLLLKDQQQGMITWIKNVGGLSKTTRGDMVAKINKLEKALAPEDQELFLKDLVDTKLGVNVTADDAKTIMDLSKKIETASKDVDKRGISDFGRSMLELNKFLEEKTPGKKGIKEIITNISSLQRAVQTSLDVSAIGRQGAAYIGRREWFGAAKRMAGYIKSQKNLDELAMKMYSDKNWPVIEKFKKDLGLTNLGEKMTQKEEAFASKWLDKIPGLSHSERAYTGFLSDLRYNRFTNTINSLEKRGIQTDDKALKSLAEVISAGTGRGQLPGVLKLAGTALSQTLFSPRWFASRIQLATNPFTKSGPARTEAIKSLATVAGISTAAILAFKLSGAKVEVDPRSSDFGKLKLGNTRIDLTFGQGQYIRALTQIFSGSYKSTASGEIKKLNTGEFGGRTSFDVASDFFAGKAAPNVSLLIDFMKGQDRDQNKLGIDWSEGGSDKNINSLARVLNMWVPLIGNDAMDAFADSSGNTPEGVKKALLSAGLSSIGIGMQTYGGSGQSAKNLGVDQRGVIERTLNLPIRTDPSFKPLLDKMVKENASISLPTSKTTIKPKGSKDSRNMTDKELQIYQKIYQRNLKDKLKSQSSLIDFTGKDFEKKLDKIKTDTTEKSKKDLLSGMLK